MKTLSHIGGSVLLPDQIADGVLHYALVLARSNTTDIVTLDAGDAGSVTLLIGVGVAIAVSDDRRGSVTAFDGALELERKALNAGVPFAHTVLAGAEQNLDYLDLTEL